MCKHAGKAGSTAPDSPEVAGSPEARGPDLSIIVPVATDSSGLDTTLRSLQTTALEGISCEIIVCNDGGGEPISAIAALHRCIEVRLDRNNGSYAARNAGVSVARGRSIAFLDADQSVDADWAQRGLQALRDADYVGGRIIVTPSDPGSYWQRVDARYAFPVASYLETMRFAPTANLFVTRAAFDRAGGFQETLRSGGDREFGVRCFGSGITQRFDPSVRVRHPARSLFAQLSKARRTAAGTATLEICLWGRPPLAVIGRALSMHIARIYRAIRFAAQCVFARQSSRDAADPCLAAGRALIESCYHLAVATTAAQLLLLPSQRFESREKQ